MTHSPLLLPTGYVDLDQAVLSGGVERGCVTELCGRHATLKTTVCHSLLARTISQLKTSTSPRTSIILVVDVQRDLSDMPIPDDSSSSATTVCFWRDVKTVEALIDKMANMKTEELSEGTTNTVSCPLVIIDSLPLLCEHYTSPVTRATALHRLNMFLNEWAFDKQCAIVVVNSTGPSSSQNSSSTSASTTIPNNEVRALGNGWAYAPAVVVLCSRMLHTIERVEFTLLKG